MKTHRCVQCEFEYGVEDVTPGTYGCPKCGTDGIPCRISHDFEVCVNWHELNILAVWAENYARGIQDARTRASCLKTVYTIARRLERQRPGAGALTLVGEVREVQERFPDMELRDGAGNVIVKKRDAC